MKTNHQPKPQRRIYPEELKREAVQMLLDGHSAPSVAQNLGIRHTSLLYRWKAEFLGQGGYASLPVALSSPPSTGPQAALPSLRRTATTPRSSRSCARPMTTSPSACSPSA
jgi:transposase-like protein